MTTAGAIWAFVATLALTGPGAGAVVVAAAQIAGLLIAR